MQDSNLLRYWSYFPYVTVWHCSHRFPHGVTVTARFSRPTFPPIVVTCPYYSYSQGNLSISSMRTPSYFAQGSGVAYLPYYDSGRRVHSQKTCHGYSIVMVRWCMVKPRRSAPCAFWHHTVGKHLPQKSRSINKCGMQSQRVQSRAGYAEPKSANLPHLFNFVNRSFQSVSLFFSMVLVYME